MKTNCKKLYFVQLKGTYEKAGKELEAELEVEGKLRILPGLKVTPKYVPCPLPSFPEQKPRCSFPEKKGCSAPESVQEDRSQKIEKPEAGLRYPMQVMLLSLWFLKCWSYISLSQCRCLPHCWLKFLLCGLNQFQLATVPLTGKAFPVGIFLNVGVLRKSWNLDVHGGGAVRPFLKGEGPERLDCAGEDGDGVEDEKIFYQSLKKSIISSLHTYLPRGL